LIGIAFDLATAAAAGTLPDGPDDRFEEFDKPSTIEALAAVIRSEGHDVVLLGDGREFLEKVIANPPEFVWNVAEGEGVGRCRESRVPAVLEMLGIPYSGSDPFTLAASLDKTVAKQLVSAVVPIPGGIAIPSSATEADGTPLLPGSTARAGRGSSSRRSRAPAKGFASIAWSSRFPRRSASRGGSRVITFSRS